MNMFEGIRLNGERYRHLSELPSGFDARIQPLANLSIWEHLPGDVMLHVRTRNVTPKTWPTVQVRHLPTLPPSAVARLQDEAMNTPVARRRRAASALLDLYTLHYNLTLSPTERDKVRALAKEAPEDAAAHLERLVPRDANRLHIHSSDAAATQEVSDPIPSLQDDGSNLRLHIPQSLLVEIRRSPEHDPHDSSLDGPNRLFAVEVRREVRYVANDRRDVSIVGSSTSRFTEWSDEVPAPPPTQVKAFEDAVIGRKPLYTPTRLLTNDSLGQIIATFAILVLVLIILTVLIVTLR